MPPLKLKVFLCMSWRYMDYLGYRSTLSELHYQRQLGGRIYALVFLTMGTKHQHQLKVRLGASQNQTRDFRERKVSCYCWELHRDSSIIQPMISSQQSMTTSSMNLVYQLFPLNIWFFSILSFYFSDLYIARNYTSTAFVKVIWHPEHVRVTSGVCKT